MAILICPKCRKRFAGSKSLGGGWQGARKVVGCPQCRTFFKHTAYLDVLCVIFGLVNVLFAGPLLIYRALLPNSSDRLLDGLVALGFGLFLILGNRYLFRKNVRGNEAVYSPPWERP